MKRLTLPDIWALLRGKTHSEYRLRDKAEEFIWEIHRKLSIFEPCGDDDQRSLWIEVPRGNITDWMTFSDAKKFDIASTLEEYEREWKELYPSESEWFRITTCVYEGNVFFYITDGAHEFASYRGDNHGSGIYPDAFESLERLLKEICSLTKRIQHDTDAYNAYVEANLPKQIRIGRISRKDLYRILPWKRPDLDDKEDIIRMLQDCRTYCGKPLDEMTIRSFCKYYRIAYEVYHTSDPEDKEPDDTLDDVDFYKKWHFQQIPKDLDYDSVEDFKKFKYDFYGELGFSRTDVIADNRTVPGKWVIRISISYSACIWSGLKIAHALYNAGAPLHIEEADRLIAAVQESDNVRLTSRTFHNYLNSQNETSVYTLPWEFQCDHKEFGVTREQLHELISCSEWLPETKLKIQQKVPLESPLYDLIRDEVTEPMFLYDIRMKMWKDHDCYVDTYHHSEFEKNGYSLEIRGLNTQQVYETWSEAMTTGLLKVIESRRNKR